MHKIGFMYHNGQVIEKDYAKAMEWYLKASDAGISTAMNSIGFMYKKGFGVEQDYDMAMEWYLKASDAGVASAMGNIGLMHSHGQGVEQDYGKAIECDAGDASHMRYIDYMYIHREGVEQDYGKAMEWHLKASNAGDASSMSSIGDFYRYGRGISKDPSKALECKDFPSVEYPDFPSVEYLGPNSSTRSGFLTLVKDPLLEKDSQIVKEMASKDIKATLENRRPFILHTGKTIAGVLDVLFSLRNTLSPQDIADSASFFLNVVQTADKPCIIALSSAMVDSILFGMKRGLRKSLSPSSSVEDKMICNTIAAVFTEYGKLLECTGKSERAQTCHRKAQKWRALFPPGKVHPQERSSQGSRSDIAHLPAKIFPQDVAVRSSQKNELPMPDAPFVSTLQLVYCLGLLSKLQTPPPHTPSTSNDDNGDLCEAEQQWVQMLSEDTNEQERLQALESKLIAEFMDDDLKDSSAVAEIVCLAPILTQPHYRRLLGHFIDTIENSTLLEFALLNGLSHLIQSAAGHTGYLRQSDLVSILRVLSLRLQRTHQQSSEDLYQLVRAVSNVLDAMADSAVQGLDRVEIHEPLRAYLDGLRGENSDPYLVYHAAYAYQALQYVPDNESPVQSVMRRTRAVVSGISGLVSAVKGLDLNHFMEGLEQIQDGLAGAAQMAKAGFKGVAAAVELVDKGVGLVDSLKEGFSFSIKSAWYPALRGADAFLRNGQLYQFRTLVCEAPCRRDPGFQLGVCLRLGEMAADPSWDVSTRHQAVDFLGELYTNEDAWGQEYIIKQWIFTTLTQLSDTPNSEIKEHVRTVLQDLRPSLDTKKPSLLQEDSNESSRLSYPLDVGLPLLTISPLLTRVQDIPNVEDDLRKLKKQRLKDRSKAVYIPPLAKSSPQAPHITLFPLMENVQMFLKSDRRVFLLLGDSGAGKSTFNRELEYDLWTCYNSSKDSPIPLFIHLSSIDKPEQDLIAKHLRRNDFSEPQIRELRSTRCFILICDAYDECQTIYNLYTSNQLNADGQWQAKMIIGCRSEHLGQDYRDRFQPTDKTLVDSTSSSSSSANQLQEAVIAPFSKEQIHDYIYRYVALAKPAWRAKSYLEALDRVPNLMDLIKNPFLLTLSLDVLPKVVDVDKIQDLSDAKITRVGLYDRFIEHWLEREKKRLGSKDLSQQARAAFETLVDEGFAANGMDYLKRLAAVIYQEQGGHPIVEYSRFKDEHTWKAAFFSREEENRLLREACPLARSGNQHRFIHRSLLEYCFARAVFDPQENHSTIMDPQHPAAMMKVVGRRRGSMSSIFSFYQRKASDEQQELTLQQQTANDSPLSWRSFVDEPSILQFLAERVQQEPAFKQQLLQMVEHSKADKSTRTAAANAITILVRAGTQFNYADLRGIQIPGADLSWGVFEHAQLQGADLRSVNLRNIGLLGADLSNARMTGVHFGEWPYLQEESAVYSCAYSPEEKDKGFALGREDGTIAVYDTTTWTLTRVLRGHLKRVTAVVYSPSGHQIASGSKDKTVRLWNVQTGTSDLTLIGHTDAVWSVVYSPTGGRIASGSRDKTVRLWDAKTGASVFILNGHTGAVWSVIFSPTGHQLCSSSGDHTLRLWDAHTGHLDRTLRGHSSAVWSAAFSPTTGHQIASGSEDKTVRLWDTQTGACGLVLSGHTDGVMSVAYSPTGHQIASSSFDSTIRLWDAHTGTPGPTLSGHTSTVASVVYSPSGHQLASGSYDNTVRLWDAHTGGATSPAALSGHAKGVVSVVFAPNGHQIASGSWDGTVRLWNAKTGIPNFILTGHTDMVTSVVFSPSSHQVASSSYDNTVRLWDAHTGTSRWTLRGHTGGVTSVVYSPTGHQIASGSDDATIRLWDAYTGQSGPTLTGHTSPVRSVVYSPNGQQLASGSYDHTVRLWDAQTGDALGGALTGHTKPIWTVEYSPTGMQIASGGEDKTLRLWDAYTGGAGVILRGHGDGVISATFSRSGQKIVSGSLDRTVRLWDVALGECVAIVIEFERPISCVTWKESPDGGEDSLATGSVDKFVRAWQVMKKETQEDEEKTTTMKEGGQHIVRLQWRSSHASLDVTEVNIQNAQGLSRSDITLLKQRGVVGKPISPPNIRTASDKLISMAAVVSQMKIRTKRSDSETSVVLTRALKEASTQL
ncbi:hypothetical protein BGZ67_004145 [Mortierella alpina]|nr:hypothetical protein BGZ67_004145 [Mortierella alpina]